MSYTIKLENGKYLVTNDNGSLTILRHGDPWPAAEELKHVKLVLCLAQRIEELETELRQAAGMLETVADCSTNECEDCREHAALAGANARNVLEQRA